jgi:predicted enzyme related to lactoylglutathione lyase
VAFRTEPIPFAVREPTVDLDAVPNVGWGVAIWLRADDPDEVHASFVAQGVSIMAPPQEGPFGRFFTFADPDGYLITVHGGAG